MQPFIIHPSSFILFTVLGSTLSNDQLSDKRFDFQFVNPPYGYEWSKDYDAATTRRDLHPYLRADYVLANPPFNDSDWFRKDDDVRWQFGVPPSNSALT